MRCRSATNLKLIVLKTVSFSHKTAQSCHCEEQSDAAIFDETNRHPGTKHGKTEQNGMCSTFGTNTFCFLSHLVFAYFVPGSHPFDFKIAASGARALLAMTQNWNVIFGKGAFLQYSGIHSTISIRINVSFFQRNPPVLSLRGRSAAAAIFKVSVWHPGTKHGSANRQKSRRTSRISPLRARRRTPKSSGSE